MTTGKTILLIDDEVDILSAVSFFLMRKNIEVITAKNGLEGLNILKQAVKKPDLILLDGHMPIMNGEEFLRDRKMKNIFTEIPVVFFLSETWKENNLNVIAHISKPFDMVTLLEKIEALLK